MVCLGWVFVGLGFLGVCLFVVLVLNFLLEDGSESVFSPKSVNLG